jgi:hypothetical protein
VLHLKNKLPLLGYCGGPIAFGLFITGTGIILSRDVCINLANNMPIIHQYEDVHTSNVLRELKYSLNDITELQYRWELLINDTNNIIPPDLNNILYFRVRNNDRNNDIIMFTNLCKKIYNLSL